MNFHACVCICVDCILSIRVWHTDIPSTFLIIAATDASVGDAVF